MELELDELDVTSAESKATYEEIKKYVLCEMVGDEEIVGMSQVCEEIRRELYE